MTIANYSAHRISYSVEATTPVAIAVRSHNQAVKKATNNQCHHLSFTYHL